MSARGMTEEAVEVLARRNFEAEQGDGWDDLPEQVKPGWRKEARAQAETVAPFIAAQALEEAADSIAAGGNISRWLRARARAAAVRGEG